MSEEKPITKRETRIRTLQWAAGILRGHATDPPIGLLDDLEPCDDRVLEWSLRCLRE